MRYPASYKLLIGEGYVDAQVPAWINRPDSHLPPEEAPDAALDAEEGLQGPDEPAEALSGPDEPGAGPVTLPTLGTLEVTVETPAHREVELREPQAPAGVPAPAGAGAGVQGPAGAGAGVQPAAAGLREVYRQDQGLEVKLRKQNIIQVADGRYLQARPDGAGGVELVPLDASQLERRARRAPQGRTENGTIVVLGRGFTCECHWYH